MDILKKTKQNTIPNNCKVSVFLKTLKTILIIGSQIGPLSKALVIYYYVQITRNLAIVNNKY